MRDEFPPTVLRRNRRAVRRHRRMEERNADEAEVAEIITAQRGTMPEFVETQPGETLVPDAPSAESAPVAARLIGGVDERRQEAHASTLVDPIDGSAADLLVVHKVRTGPLAAGTCDKPKPEEKFVTGQAAVRFIQREGPRMELLHNTGIVQDEERNIGQARNRGLPVRQMRNPPAEPDLFRWDQSSRRLAAVQIRPNRLPPGGEPVPLQTLLSKDMRGRENADVVVDAHQRA